jgi:HAD superfamily hydrolase (TIGR01490 family)
MEAAFFDLDKTLLPGAALYPLAREMHRQRMFSTRELLRAVADQLAYRVTGSEDDDLIERARESTLAAVQGRTPGEVRGVALGVAKEEILPRFYPQAVELLSRHKLAGREVYICSSSPQDFLGLLAEELGIDGVIGTRAEVMDGRYTGRLEGPMCHGAEKARRVVELAAERDIDLAKSFGYSDSINDLPLLELVGTPVATNPDHRLLRMARRRGWEVIDYRQARRRTMIAGAAGGVAAGAAAGGYALGYVVGRRRTQRVHTTT